MFLVVWTIITFQFTLNFANSIYFNGTLNQREFPSNFKFGVATSAYQIEGGWNENGKGENIWDYFTHTFPDKVVDGTNGDIACDSYHKFKEDVQMVKSLGVNFYRFSLSWTRILPNGLPNSLNSDGIRYYNELINDIIKNGMKPMVTLFHFDLPQSLQEMGGLPNDILVQYFVEFARIAFNKFGDRVKTWITINEPMQICRYGYGGFGWMAPGFNQSGLADYLCARTLTKAHVKIFKLYDQEFRRSQGGIVGYTFQSYWFEPRTNSPEDITAAARMFDFYTGIFTNPIFGDGDWPSITKDRISLVSENQNLQNSRLPEFSPDEILENKNSADFIGLNYYFGAIVKHKNDENNMPIDWDIDVGISYQPEENEGYIIGPQGLRKILKKLKLTYGDIPIYITENGLGTKKGLKDYDRANYFLTYLSACLDAIYQDEVNLHGYTAWSLMDNFEGILGYTKRFGLYDVDFNDPERPRTRKLSGDVYADVIKNRKLPAKTLDIPENPESDEDDGDEDDESSNLSYNVTLIGSLLILLYFVYVNN